MGKCPDCDQWNTLKQSLTNKPPSSWTPDNQTSAPITTPQAQPLSQIRREKPQPRIPTNINELDRVLGGDKSSGFGLVPGSAVLIGGPPGIGKSTLTLQVCSSLASNNTRVLYVSSEESSTQICSRAQRLNIPAAAADSLHILTDTNLPRILQQAQDIRPAVMIIDSVQMLNSDQIDAAPGSITQVRQCCAQLVSIAKATGTAIIMIGHVTKQGSLAGPRVLEHMVDAVLAFEGDRHHAHRLVRSIKNRFGTTSEIGIFQMTDAGLAQRPQGQGVIADPDNITGPGCVLCPAMTGSRCMLVEIQALTATGFVGAAKRKVSSLDASRLAMIIAVLEQHAELRLADRDIFASAVGGIRVVEPAADLALLLAIAGAHFKRSAPPATAIIGEVGLSGEIRAVSRLDQRLKEAARLGCTHAIIPARNLESIASTSLKIQAVPNVNAAIQLLA